MFYEFTFPIKPVAKGRPRFSVFNRIVRARTPDKTRRAEKDIRYFLMDQYKGSPLQGALQVDITFHIVRPKSVSEKKRKHVTVNPDLDNFIKTVFDASNEVLWRDDSQVIKLSASKIYSDKDMTYMCVQEVL